MGCAETEVTHRGTCLHVPCGATERHPAPEDGRLGDRGVARPSFPETVCAGLGPVTRA